MPTFKPNVIALGEDNFEKLSKAGRKRVMITIDNQHFCPEHAQALAKDVVIASVGYVDPRRKSKSFCIACNQRQTFANLAKKA